MFGFLHKSGVRSPSATIRRALENDGLSPGMEAASALAVVESRGSYAGRKVTYFRVFDSARAAARGVAIHAYGDLDTHPNLVLRSGHIEKDGMVVITWRAPLPDAETPVREWADRGLHADDERIVFTDAGARPGGQGP
jgi:hypothetical protein